MKRICYALVLGLLVSVPLQAIAVERSTEAEALALIQKAQEYIKTYGVEKAVIEFNRLDSPFNSVSEINKKGDLYLYTLTAIRYVKQRT